MVFLWKNIYTNMQQLKKESDNMDRYIFHIICPGTVSQGLKNSEVKIIFHNRKHCQYGSNTDT